MELATQPQYAISPGVDEALYVATDLGSWKTHRAAAFGRDVQIDDTAFRRLDPEYFAWLRARMFAVKSAADAGRVPPAAFDELRSRFNRIQQWAIAAFGESALLTVARHLTPESYRPPLPEPEERRGAAAEPAPPRRNPEADRLARARGLVDGIRDQALAVGWTMEGLYFSDGFERRPFAARYGLVCYIRAHHRIGEVTRESIEIIGPPPLKVRTRFYNREVGQPGALGRADVNRTIDTSFRFRSLSGAIL